ncbi:hypothetical protein IC582_010869 [Cucumis melo]
MGSEILKLNIVGILLLFLWIPSLTLNLFLFVQALIMTSTSTNRPLYKINPSHHFYALLSCLSHLEKTTHNIKTKLIPDQLALFRKTKFGHFLDLNIVFNGPLIHYLLLREVEDEGKDCISFLLGGIVCTFVRREFNIITGLMGS